MDQCSRKLFCSPMRSGPVTSQKRCAKRVAMTVNTPSARGEPHTTIEDEQQRCRQLGHQRSQIEQPGGMQAEMQHFRLAASPVDEFQQVAGEEG